MYLQPSLVVSNGQGNCIWCIWMAAHSTLAISGTLLKAKHFWYRIFWSLCPIWALREPVGWHDADNVRERGGRIRFLTVFKTFLDNAWGTFLICAHFQFHATPLSLPLWLTYEVWGSTSQLTFYHKFKRQLRSYKVLGFWSFVREHFGAGGLPSICFGMFSQRHALCRHSWLIKG